MMSNTNLNEQNVKPYDPNLDLTIKAEMVGEDVAKEEVADSVGGFTSYKETKNYYEEMLDLRPSFSQYNSIGGMPPTFDNYIDPPSDFFGGLGSIRDTTKMDSLGMDYTEGCIVRGQFINLIPIDIRFRGLSSIAAKAADIVSTTVTNMSSFDTEEVMQSQLRWNEYWLTVNYHFRACVMMLDMVGVFGNGASAGISPDIPAFGHISKLLSANGSVEVALDDGSWMGANTQFGQSDHDPGKSMLRAIAGLTAVDRPSIPMYVDGFIENTESTTSNIGESEIYGAWKQAGEATNGNAGGIVKEWAQHSGTLENSTMLWNPVVPKVFKDFGIERVHNYKQKLISIGSDPLSILLYVLRVLCMYYPFIRPRAASNSLNTYRAPFYVQAYSKGMLNVKFGIIQSVEISRDPQFVTSQGIPTQLELNISLCSLSTMEVLPDMSGAWNMIIGDNSYGNFIGKEGAAINYLATICGLNTYNINFMGRFKKRFMTLKASVSRSADLSANISRFKVDVIDKLVL